MSLVHKLDVAVIFAAAVLAGTFLFVVPYVRNMLNSGETVMVSSAITHEFRKALGIVSSGI